MARPKRKALSKNVRFEVFKRDGFMCAYCGKSPPMVVLEIDHIVPISKGGSDDLNNLITACFDCNRGKRDVPLDKIPQQLADNLDVLREKEKQLREYNKLIKSIERRIQKNINSINGIFSSFFPEYELSERFINVSLKLFLKRLPFNEIEDAMKVACSRIHFHDNAIKYFCGICWQRIRTRENG
jgi:hypothetical protein